MAEILRIVVLPVALMALIIGVFYLFFGRSKAAREDPAGLRSFASFRAPPKLLEQHAGASHDDLDPSEAGAAVVDALRRELDQRALTTGSVDHKSYGYTVDARCGDQAFFLRVGWVGDQAEDGTPLDWLVSVDPTGRRFDDGPELRRLLLELHASLTALSARHLRWHRREDWLAGRTAGNARPLDRSLG
jgi:hypothetical protein